jgi:hypothetical protein
MQINLLTYPRIYYTIGRWLGMVVHVTLGILRAGPPQKRLRAYTQIKEKKAWAQA